MKEKRKLDWIEDLDHLEQVKKKHRDFLMIAFWGQFSESAKRALGEWEEFAAEHEEIPLYVVDVERVKGAHKEFQVRSVPTVISLKEGELLNKVEGVESARFYGVRFAGAAPRRAGGGGTGRVPRRVVVYSGPSCPACSQLKSYLRRHGVSYREVDISRDQSAAQRIARRSGQMAVPQTDIDGRLVVGFDKTKLDPLLGIQAERSDET